MKEKRARIVIALVVGLLVLLWLLPDDSTRAEEAPQEKPTAVKPPATPPTRAARAERAKAARQDVITRSFKGLAAAIPGEAMVLRCKLSASLDPERDLFVPGWLDCRGGASLPFAYADGWFTTVVPAPSGAGALCQDFQPEDAVKAVRDDPVSGVGHHIKQATTGLNWTGAGTHSASCQVGEYRTDTIRGVVSGPESTDGGSPINYVVWPLNSRPLKVQDDGTYSGEVFYFHDGAQPTLGRVQLQAMTKTEDGSRSFRAGSVEVRLAPTLEAVADFEVTPANIAAGLDPDTVLRIEKTTGFFHLNSVQQLVDKAAPHSPEVALLQRMHADRTGIQTHKDTVAWEKYDQHREQWVTNYATANNKTVDEAADAFDEHWQNTLDGMDAQGASKFDAAGQGLDGSGWRDVFDFEGQQQAAREHWINEYLQTHGGSHEHALQAYQESQGMLTEEE